MFNIVKRGVVLERSFLILLSKRIVALLCCYRTKITVSSETEAFREMILLNLITTDWKVKSGFCSTV